MANEQGKRILDLQLDHDDEDDHPRRLLRIPATGEILVFGGERGAVVKIDGSSTQLIRHWDDDDDIRAVAVSPDSTRIAVGFESGSTLLYTFSDEEVAAAADSHPFVSSKPSPRHERAGPVFPACVRDMQFLDTNTLAVATEEGGCILDCETLTRTLEDDIQKHHDGSGIRGIAFHDNVLATLAMDGRLCLWKKHNGCKWSLLRRESGRCVTKKDVGEILGADAWDRSCRPHFMGDILSLPGETYLQLRKDTKEFDQLPTDTPVHIESIVAMASKDSYLISSGRDKRVVLWKIQADKDGALKASFVRQIDEMDSAPTDLMWDDIDKGVETLRIACANGKLVTITGRDNIVPKDTASFSASAEVKATRRSSPLKDTASPLEKAVKKAMDDLDSEDDWDGVYEKEATRTKPAAHAKNSFPKSTSRLMQSSKNVDDSSSDEEDFDVQDDAPSAQKNRFIDDEAADSDDDSVAPAPPAGSKDTDDKTAGPVGASLSPGRDYGASEDDIDMVDTDAIYDEPHVRASDQPTVELPEQQPPFAPSSSPLDLPRRFMCWNHVGSVTLRRDDDGDNRSTVDIHFTDSAFRRPISFTDNLGFIIGSLGEDGGIFATDIVDDDDGDDNDDILGDDVPGLSEKTKSLVKRSQRSKDRNKQTGSSIYFHRFETFGALRDKDWYLTLPTGERALGCATGEGWAAVFTSRRFLRLFSSGGNQGQVIWLDGEPITMAGRSRFLAVFCHQGEPFRDGSQNIGYKVMDVVANRVVATGSASCVSAGATLTWVGFSNDGSLVAMDSEGMVSMLVVTDPTDNSDTQANWQWMPMLDTLGLRKSSDDSYWPITVYDGKVVCVPLKGGTKYPDAARRPVTAALGLRLPLARGTVAKSNALEELSIRASIALKQKKIFHSIQDLPAVGEQDAEFDREYLALSAQVDKVTLKLFAATVEAGKLERALDLVDRLHLEKSFELAMAIADNHRKLVDLIEDAKDRKFSGDDNEEEEDEFESPDFTDGAAGRPRISPDSIRIKGKRPSDDDEAGRHVRQKQTYA